jgi:LacI family transcriptional regulator
MSAFQKQLARQLNLSQSTVSRALRNMAGVNERTRRAVHAEAEKLGYHIDSTNFEARTMRMRAVGNLPSTGIICATVYDDDDAASFGGRILRGMNEAARKADLEVVMVTSSVSGTEFPRVVMRKQVDGVVRLLGDLEVDRGVTPCPVPWVSLLYDVPGIDLVTVDNFVGARAVGRRLFALGHRRVAFIGPETDLARERLAGLRAAAREAGGDIPDALVRLEKFVASDKPTRDLLDAFIGSRLDRLPFTALVAYNDYMAEIALQYFDAKGIRIPGAVSVAGFDGVLPASFHEKRRIASAAIPLEQVGAAALELLLWRIVNPGAARRRVVLDTAFVEGDTVSRPTTEPACSR